MSTFALFVLACAPDFLFGGSWEDALAAQAEAEALAAAIGDVSGDGWETSEAAGVQW